MTSLGSVLCRCPSAAAGSAAQLASEVVSLEARPKSSVRMTAPPAAATPSPATTAIAVVDEVTVVELKGIVGRLCSANRRETVLKIKGTVDLLVSAFVDGFDVVIAI